MENILLVPFTNESKDFVHGFECGQIWQDLESRKQISRPIHIENIEQIKMMCKHFGIIPIITELGSGWANLKIELARVALN